MNSSTFQRFSSVMLGVRDLGIGLAILAGYRLAYGLRAVSDLTDAVTVARVRPAVSAGATVFAAWAIAAGLCGRSSGADGRCSSQPHREW